MNQDADIKNNLKNIIQEHLGKVVSSLFLRKSLAIIDESAGNKESFIAVADRIRTRTALFINKKLAERVFQSLTVEIEKIASPD